MLLVNVSSLCQISVASDWFTMSPATCFLINLYIFSLNRSPFVGYANESIFLPTKDSQTMNTYSKISLQLSVLVSLQRDISDTRLPSRQLTSKKQMFTWILLHSFLSFSQIVTFLVSTKISLQETRTVTHIPLHW